MKRKIAAIVAADIAGYSKLVAEDEEETLRRLASYRSVFDDFIAKASGRIFNTAGDAVLAEFPSAVDAVRCAIDIQESLRTRNLAYPASRQMHFRMGITIGDVVERDGDLLGEGVNIAARLEGLAEPGGICVAHSVYEQVSHKLSIQFADIGEQEVKNIPTPVHAYIVTPNSQYSSVRTLPTKKPVKRTLSLLTASIILLCAAGLGGAAYYLTVVVRAPTSGGAVPGLPSSLVPGAPVNVPSSAARQIPPAQKLVEPESGTCGARTAGSRIFATEPPRRMGALGFGEKAYVDDGQCPAGYIKQIIGGGHGVGRRVQCVAC